MPVYRNIDSARRVWPFLVDTAGRTVDLEPGATVDLPEAVDAAWLAPVSTSAAVKPSNALAAAEAEAAKAAADVAAAEAAS